MKTKTPPSQKKLKANSPFETFILAILLFIPLYPSGAGAQVFNVGIMDAAIDLKHKEMEGFVDKNRLKSVEAFSILMDRFEDVWKVNKMELQLSKDNFCQDPYYSVVSPAFDFDVNQGKEKRNFISQLAPEAMDTFQRTGSLYHGTHVAGIVIGKEFNESVSNIKVNLVPFNLGQVYKSRAGDTLDSSTLSKRLQELVSFEEKYGKLLASYEKTIKTLNIRVLNVSQEVETYEVKFKNLLDNSSDEVKNTRQEEVRKLAEAEVDIERRFFSKLLLENPRTLFVVAAGNEGVEIGNGSGHDFLLNQSHPNLLFVGALSPNEQAVSGYSNFSSKHVKIATSGGAYSLKQGGGYMFSQGTSMSAPRVTKRIIEISSQNPEMMPAEVIEGLIRDHTCLNENIKEQVSNGCVLKN